jgi:GNAT superfamily N-acetyltransferase
MEFEKSNIENIHFLRNEYLRSLPKFQDVFLEFIIWESACYQLQFNGIAVGYVIISDKCILVEFYVCKDFRNKMPDLFSTIIQKLNIAAVYCKSFDVELLNCCIIKSFPYKIIGYLFRDYVDKGGLMLPETMFRYADNSDYEYLFRQKDEVFEPKNLLAEFIQNKSIVLLHLGTTIVGCGFITRVCTDFHYYDIGVWVDPGFRRQGYATQIMLFLKGCCLKNEWIPICACGVSNIGSKKMLENIGYYSSHKLIEFQIL